MARKRKPESQSQHEARLRALDIAHVWHPYTQMDEYPHRTGGPIIVKGRGVYVTDAAGRRYIDGYSQMWCNVFGHNVPEINAAITAQLKKIAHSSLFSASSEPAITLAARLSGWVTDKFRRDLHKAKGPNPVKPSSPLPHVFFSDNGSTAVESALKIALQYHRNKGDARRRYFLTFSDAYHGDTAATMTLGGVELFRQAYEPLTFKVLRAPYPMRSNILFGEDRKEKQAALEAMGALDGIFEKHGHEIAGAIIEPGAQGAGGIRPLHPAMLLRLRGLCTKHGALLIADEVLTAFGRCGHMLACQAANVIPDLLCLAKGLTGGYLPLAVTMASDEVYDAFRGRHEDYRHLFHGHTYTGNQLGCAAALAALDLMEDRKLHLHVVKLQTTVFKHLERISQSGFVSGIRHMGMMIGIELGGRAAAGQDEATTGYTNTWGNAVCARALELGAIIRPLGNIVVLMPVLASTPAELSTLFEIVEQAIEETRGGTRPVSGRG